MPITWLGGLLLIAAWTRMLGWQGRMFAAEDVGAAPRARVADLRKQTRGRIWAKFSRNGDLCPDKAPFWRLGS